MTSSFDVAVVGLGAMGSATLLDLARRGVRAVGLDRHAPPHEFGSTHGRSRIIRQAYYEDPVYVPLVRRAYERWELLARETGLPILRQTGGLMLGEAGGELVSGARLSAVTHQVPFEELETRDIERRFPDLRPPAGTVGILEPLAGVLDPEQCVRAMLSRASNQGAEIRTGVTVQGWNPTGTRLTLSTTAGPIEAGAVVLAAGPWLGELIGEVLPLTVERQVMYWFHPRAGSLPLGPDRLPIFMWEWPAGHFFYGIPDLGDGLKIARHHEGPLTAPNAVDRRVTEVEVNDARELLQRVIPSAAGALAETAVCLYTDTPDYHFVLGPLPADPRVILVSACSGHGFKFASAVGEIASDLAMTGAASFDLSAFSPTRFGKLAP